MVKQLSCLYLDMQKFFYTLLLLFVLQFEQAQAQKLPKPDKVLSILRQANKYFMDKWPDAGKETITNKVRPSNLWTRAVYYEGLVGLYQVDPQQIYDAMGRKTQMGTVGWRYRTKCRQPMLCSNLH